MTSTQGIAAHINAFIQCVFDDSDIIEIRRHKDGENARSLFTTPADLEALIPRLRKENGDGWNIYVGINPRRQRGNGSKAKECDGTKCGKCGKCVKFARCIFADFDHISLEVVRDKLAQTKLPPPSLMVNSGHGMHSYWRLSEPLHELDAWTGFQIDLAAHLGSDPAVKDPPRIMRLPGFMNTKKHPYVQSAVVEVPV